MLFERRQFVQLLACAAGSAITGSGNSAAQSAATLPAQPATHPTPQPESSVDMESIPMEKVVGIGGIFFRAKDSSALAQWYKDHLGIELTPTSKDSPVWHTEAGVTVYAPFPTETKYFGDPSKQWMVNFRVRNLDRMAAQLKAAGIPITVETDPTGSFARIHDPEGNPIELWQPA